MYSYHPVFKYVKKLIRSKKFGKIRYVISNFRYPSLKKNNNKYKITEGKGFFNDAASYLVSLESYLFENRYSLGFFKTKKIKKNVDLRGYIFLDNGHQSRHYFWGEGQNYTNNLEIFLMMQLYILTNFSVKLETTITLKIFRTNSKIIKFKPTNQFKLMFNKF